MGRKLITNHFSKQEQEVNYETITGEKKARQAIFQSLMGSGAATIFLFPPGML